MSKIINKINRFLLRILGDNPFVDCPKCGRVRESFKNQLSEKYEILCPCGVHAEINGDELILL